MAAKLWNMLKLIPSIPASRKNSMITGLARIDENSDELILSLYNLPDPTEFLDAKSGTYYAWFHESQDNSWKKIGELQRKNGLTFSLRKKLTVNGDGVFITAEEKNRDPKEPGNVILSSNPELFYRNQVTSVPEAQAEIATPVEKSPAREIVLEPRVSKVEEQTKVQSSYAIVKNDHTADTPKFREEARPQVHEERPQEPEHVEPVQQFYESEEIRQPEQANESEWMPEEEQTREAKETRQPEIVQPQDRALESEKSEQPAITRDDSLAEVSRLSEVDYVEMEDNDGVRASVTEDAREETLEEEVEESSEVREAEERTTSPHSSFTGMFEGGKKAKVSDYTYDAAKEVPAGFETTERLKSLLSEFYSDLPSDEVMGVVKNRYQMVKTELDLKAYWEKIKQYAIIFYDETRLRELVEIISRDVKYLIELIGLDNLWDKIEGFIREVIRIIDLPDWIAKVKGWINHIDINEWYLTAKKYINAILAEIDPVVLWSRLKRWIEDLLERMNIDEILLWIKMKICEMRAMSFEDFKAECSKLLNQLVDALKLPELRLAVIKVTVKDKFTQVGAFFQRLKGGFEEKPSEERPSDKRERSVTGWNSSFVNQYFNPFNYAMVGMGAYPPAGAVASPYTIEMPYANLSTPYHTIHNPYANATNLYVPLAQPYAFVPYIGGTMQTMSVNPYMVPATYPAADTTNAPNMSMGYEAAVYRQPETPLAYAHAAYQPDAYGPTNYANIPGQSYGVENYANIPGQSYGVGNFASIPGQSDGMGNFANIPGQSDGMGNFANVPAQSYSMENYANVPGQSYPTESHINLPGGMHGMENYAQNLGHPSDAEHYADETGHSYRGEMPYATNLSAILSNLYADPLIFRPAVEEPAGELGVGLFEPQHNALEQTLLTEPIRNVADETPYQCPFLQWPGHECGCNFKVSRDAAGDPRYVHDGWTDKHFFITPDGEITSR